MAKEIQFTHDTGATCYANLTDRSGQWYNTVGAAFEAFNAANWTDYDIAATEFGTSGVYSADLPTVSAGVYHLQARVQAGGGPAQSDTLVAVGDLESNGTIPVGAGNVTVSSTGLNLPLNTSGVYIAGTVGACILDLANGGRLDLKFDSILDDTGTSGVAISAATANAIADALLDRTAGVESNRTIRQAMRLMLAALVGKLSGAATTTVTIRDTNDTIDRVVATVDANGNRSAVALNAG